MIFEIDPSIVTPEDLRADPDLAEAADKEYILHQSGPRTAIPSSVAYLPFTHLLPAEYLSARAKNLIANESPNYVYKEHDQIIRDRLAHPKKIGQIEYNFDISNYSPFFKSEPGKKYATMLMMLQYPFSRGSIHLPPSIRTHGRLATAADKPVIDPRYYLGQGGQIDFDLMVQCQAFADKICRTQPLADIIVKRVFPPEVAPDSNGDGASPSDQEISDTQPLSQPNPTNHNPLPSTPAQANTTTKTTPQPQRPQRNAENYAPWVRETTITDWHPVGTCSMDPTPAAGGVVDDRLRVHGVRGLRVCDASIMPLQISAHLQATVYAIGEKGAEMMKEDLGG